MLESAKAVVFQSWVGLPCLFVAWWAIMSFQGYRVRAAGVMQKPMTRGEAHRTRISAFEAFLFRLSICAAGP